MASRVSVPIESTLVRYLANPGKNHWEVVKWILKYLKTQRFGKNSAACLLQLSTTEPEYKWPYEHAEIVESKEIEVAKIGTKDNAADTFTKVVPGPKFKYCMKILGVGIN
ncbi:hypothetical protein Tco_0266745 [Tanacetum coccineum]